jgi:predicted nucleotidyltransferase
MAGVACYLYGNNRYPTDIDVIIREIDLDKIMLLFQRKPVFDDNTLGKATKIHLDRIELVCHLSVKEDNNLMPFNLDEEMISRIQFKKINDLVVPVLAIEDVIVFKAMLQRGKEYGKFDLEDISSIWSQNKINNEYLLKRIRACRAEVRVVTALKRIGINVL